ncbi:hypothetical protein IC582_014851 [Cucumis melo]|uniref:Uncharacterized protein LOC103490925 n=2 Tax=Cucumis melo TaxID=3656 RepID=A0A1S3BKT1_CUCME|nr:uncharacterized protein LOC103490925 [Cucumis melo]XP_008448900.1 uncharacterized protein LOC103490925 [Cucumis melo]XP_050942455.1 uncharacterized protein LOC103490925 [Cucumis melo]TYK19483.1 uncharacterized protein E5676_scaffold443G001380 [Cucumis melo var. makuwa]
MGDFSIQISSNLVNMLIDDTDKPKRKPRRNRSKVPQESKKPQVKVDQKNTSDDSGTLKGSTSDGWPHQPPPLFLPIIPPVHPANAELDAIRSVLQESERVVEKLQKQEDNMLKEVTQRAKDLHDKEFKLPYQKPMPCMAESQACFQCYKDHPNDYLKCARLVKNFENCNRQARQKISSAEK